MIQFRIPLIHDTYRFSQMFLEAIQTVDTNAPDTSNQERCMKLLIIRALLLKPNFVSAHHLVHLHPMVDELEHQLASSEASENAPVHLDEYSLIPLHNTVQYLVHYDHLLSKKEREDITLASITNACIGATSRALLPHPAFQPLLEEVRAELDKQQIPEDARETLLPLLEDELPGYVNPVRYADFICRTLKAKPLAEFNALIEQYILQIRMADMREKIITHTVEALLDNDPLRIVAGGLLQITAEAYAHTATLRAHDVLDSFDTFDFENPTPVQMVYVLICLVLFADIQCVQAGNNPSVMFHQLHPDAPTL